MDEDRSKINSTIKGKAYEYACLTALVETVKSIRPVEIVQNNSLLIARGRYLNDITEEERNDMLTSAKAGIEAIIKMEPKITEDGQDKLIHSIKDNGFTPQETDEEFIEFAHDIMGRDVTLT